jgi:MFS superfamily sulfate permease-like transporter
MAIAHPASASSPEIPRGDLSGFVRYWKKDVLSGFFVFLIALPLCIGISLASGYPPMAGLFTAIIGAIVTTFISNSELTIKGPAAGLIVICLGCIQDFGGGSTFSETATNIAAYRAALAVGVTAGILQVLFGVFRAGVLGEFFPRSAIHGMLVAIGIIIIAKQIPIALGIVDAHGEPFELLMQIPEFILRANPAIAAIGLVSLSILFLWPLVRKRFKPLAAVPPQIIVLVVAVLMGLGLNLLRSSSYELQGHQYQLGEQYLVTMPREVFGMFQEVTFPDFRVLLEPKAWKWIFMFFIIGTLESILSAKAVDSIDPWKRKSNMDRDVVAVGVANTLCALVGGLPMISEIVRSKANIDNGARTRFANMWHGVFLLLCVALLPTTLHLIPKAALAAMLVYTGSRLAHPSEFIHIYRIGREQLLIFVVTIIVTLATDLLIGIMTGIGLKIFIHMMNGVPLHSLFKTFLSVEQVDEQTCLIHARESAVFSNWIPFKRQIEELALVQRQNIILDVSDARLIDKMVLEKLQEMQQELDAEGLKFEIVGLDWHQPMARHEQPTPRRGMARMRRLTVIIDSSLEQRLEQELLRRGVTCLAALPCRASADHAALLSRQGLLGFPGLPSAACASDDCDSHAVGALRGSDALQLSRPQVRMELILSFDLCDEILAYLRNEVMPHRPIIACMETIELVLPHPGTSATELSDAPSATRA